MTIGLRLALAMLLPLLGPLAARAHDFIVGDLRIDHPMAFATPPGARTGAAYFAIENRGRAPDRLIAARTDAAERAELHATIREGDVVRMRAVAAVAVAGGATVKLQRGGLHLMLVNLRQPLREGDRVGLTLVFEKAGEVAVVVNVESARGAPASHGDHAH